MLLHIPNVLTPDELRQARQLLADGPWEDGLATTGTQSAQVKHNLQLAQTSPQAQALGSLVLAALNRNALFFSAALPNRIFPPMFNCYQGGMTFGNHVDNAVRNDPFSGQWLRTDVSCTLFFTDPDEYQGGELIVEDTYGSHAVKLPAGDMILYPSTNSVSPPYFHRARRSASCHSSFVIFAPSSLCIVQGLRPAPNRAAALRRGPAPPKGYAPCWCSITMGRSGNSARTMLPAAALRLCLPLRGRCGKFANCRLSTASS